MLQFETHDGPTGKTRLYYVHLDQFLYFVEQIKPIFLAKSS